MTMEAINSLGRVYTGELCYNYLREDQQARVSAAFGTEKFKQLTEMKHRYDPSNLFRLDLSIPPA